MQSSQGRTASGRTLGIPLDVSRAVVVLLLLASFTEVRSVMPCTSDSNCNYDGCPCPEAPCPAGTFNNVSSCVQGGKGRGGGSSCSCTTCLAGTYSPAGATACVTCSAGKHSNVTGASACVNCGAGKFSGRTGATVATVCVDCGAGLYSGETGAVSCQPCPLNFGSPIGSSSVSNCTCAPGFFGPAGGPCTACPSGTYKKDAGTAAACTPCPVAGQWSPTKSVDAADCMTMAQTAVSTVCQQTTVTNIGEQQFEKCRQLWQWSLDDLFAAGKNGTISFKLGALANPVPDVFEVWVCIKGDPCATDVNDDYFCYVYDEAANKFVAWGPNTVVKLVVIPETLTQQEARIVQLEALVANLTKKM